MNSKFHGSHGLLKTAFWAIAFGVLSNLLFWILIPLITKLRLDFSTVIIIFLIACLSVTVFQLLRYYYFLRKLGVIGLHNKAEETILKGLEEANNSYKWLGTSAYYVLCTPKIIQNYIVPQHETIFLFITIDPECSAALSAQAEWARIKEKDLINRINDTKRKIEQLNEGGTIITWEGHSTFPTFRIVIINEKKVLVSFYEEGKLGKDCEQLEINGDGLLGQWFIQFFEKSRKLANYMRLERIIGRFLLSKANISKSDLLDAMGKSYKGEDFISIKQIVDDLYNEQYG